MFMLSVLNLMLFYVGALDPPSIEFIAKVSVLREISSSNYSIYLFSAQKASAILSFLPGLILDTTPPRFEKLTLPLSKSLAFGDIIVVSKFL